MKKASGILLLLIYFTFSTGVVINLHYCMDRLDSVQFGVSDTDTCNKCGMEKSEGNNCCDNETKIFKIDDDQQVKGLNFKIMVPETLFVKIPDYNDPKVAGELAIISFNNHAPPLYEQDIYLQNSVFRI